MKFKAFSRRVGDTEQAAAMPGGRFCRPRETPYKLRSDNTSARSGPALGPLP